jgi:hypothetical protein
MSRQLQKAMNESNILLFPKVKSTPQENANHARISLLRPNPR